MSETLTPARPLAVIEAELDLLERDTRRKETALIANYIEVGRRLEEVKRQLAHGEWGPWLENRGYPQAKAVKLMKVFRAYGQEQQSLFGSEAKSKALENLGFQKLVQLLAIEDEEEREQFVEDHDVASISTRELDRLLKDREEALRQAEAARADASAAEEARAKMEKDMKAANASLKDKVKIMLKLRNEANRFKEEAYGLQKELQELRSRPVDVAVETRDPTSEELEALTKEAVEKARAEYAERLAALEKQLAQADGDTAAFKVYFDAWQADYGRMMGHLAKIEARDPEKAEKLKSAVRAAAERMVS